MSTPNDTQDNEQFAARAKTRFDDSVDRLDAATLSKLNRGRQAALAELSSARPISPWLRWMPAAGVAAAALIVVVMLQVPVGLETPSDAILGTSESVAADFEILIGEDSLEMIEDLEFYSWIDLAELDSTDNVG